MANAASHKKVIALDAMGGDDAPHIVLEGADKALSRYPDMRFLLHGDEHQMKRYLDKLPKLRRVSEIRHTSDVVSANERPSVALRQGKQSSMRLAIESVRTGEAGSMVSAGNTGALMAMSKLAYRTLPGIDRPAIVSIIPCRKGRSVFMDLGANIECNSHNLVQFAFMGDAFARVILGLESPRIGLLNVGSEDVKGHDSIRSAAQILKQSEHIHFCGFVEGDGLIKGVADVVVTDGFTGNIALKTAEGTGKMCAAYLKEAFSSSLMARIGGVFSYFALKRVFARIDPRLYNGAMLIGLNGITVKSHGSADAMGFANAVAVAYELATHDINEKIIEELSYLGDEEDEENLTLSID